MELTVQQQKGQEFLNSLFTKCWEDKSFTRELVATPAKAIEKITGKTFDPQGKKIKVYDQTDTAVLYINIPAKPDLANMELTDEQLEAVAGGATPLLIYGGLLLGGIVLGYLSGD